MIPFQYDAPESIAEAIRQLGRPNAMPLAGGTTMLDLMKLNVLKPESLSYIQPILNDQVIEKEGRIVIGAACTMSKLADHELVDDQLPAIRQSLILAASPQIRNMATIGGNLLQRTRSTYYRHTDMPLPDETDTVDNSGTNASDVISPSSDLAFGDDVDTSLMAVLGNGGRLVGMYPGDFAVTVVSFRGQIEVTGPTGKRTIAARDFYLTPTDSFQYATLLKPDELITAIELPITTTLRNSLYLKIRDRSSYAFALASTSIGLDFDGQGQSATIRAANVGIGGLGSVPWPSPECEQALIGRPATDETFKTAAEAALAGANPPIGLKYKVPLAKRTLVRAMQILRDQGPLTDHQLWTMQHGRNEASSF